MKIRVVRSSSGGKGKMIAGSILAGLFGAFTVACALSGDLDDLFAIMLFCALVAMGGVWLIVKGAQEKHSAASSASHEFDADAPDFVKDRLNELMFEGKSGTTTVRKTVRRVSYTGPDGVTRTTETVTHSGPDHSAPADRVEGTVTCDACGGINKLRRGQSGVCEYCGSHIQG